jgi:hypothetical protein
MPNAGWLLARVGMTRQRILPLSGKSLRNAAIVSRPRNHVGFGGIVKAASSASLAASASTSARSQASTSRRRSHVIAERAQRRLLGSLREALVDRSAGMLIRLRVPVDWRRREVVTEDERERGLSLAMVLIRPRR